MKTNNMSASSFFLLIRHLAIVAKGGRGDWIKRDQSEQIPLNPPFRKGGLGRKFPGFRSGTRQKPVRPIC